MVHAVTVACALLAMDVGEALESNQAIFALARAGGKLFAGSRSGDVGVFGHLSLAQRAARASKLRGNDRDAPDLPGAAYPLARAALAPCYVARARPTETRPDISGRSRLQARTRTSGSLTGPARWMAEGLEGLETEEVAVINDASSSWEPVATLRGHSSRIEALQVVSDCMVSASGDGTKF